jgi:hypothetical protein
MNNTQQTAPIVQKFYNPLIVSLETLEVKDKTVEGYYKQIKNNLYVGVKADYLVARDFWCAKNELKPQEFSELVKQLGFSGSTQQKYLSIGSDIRLMRVFTAGKLPMKWTNQYLLTKLTDEQFSKVEKELDPETTAKQISEIAGMSDKRKNQIANDLLNFLNLEIDKSEIDSVSTFERIVERVKTALSKIPQVKIKDEKVEKVKERLTAYISKLEAKKEKERNDAIDAKVKRAQKLQAQDLFDKSKQIGATA